jgi:hypothetical protein
MVVTHDDHDDLIYDISFHSMPSTIICCRSVCIHDDIVRLAKMDTAARKVEAP